MENKNKLFKKKAARITLLIVFLLLVVFTTQCKKDPIKGFDFYYEPPPSPNITKLNAVIKDCVPPYPVTFYQDAEYLLGTVSYFWDFGDGTTSTAQNPTHIYPEAGDYSVMLIISNEVGADTAYLDLPQLSNASIPVVADFSFEHFNENNFAPNKVLFDNNSSGAGIFDWVFGDGTELNHDNPEHVFGSAGTYTISLTARCSDGTEDETSRQVFVTNPPQIVFIDSINLMLPSAYKNNRIFIEMYHNTTFKGATVSKSPSSYPVKFKRPGDFPGGYFFDNVQFTSNEVFKFIILRDNGSEPPTVLFEILLASIDIQNNFYPKAYYQIETVPPLPDVFIDLYINY